MTRNRPPGSNRGQTCPFIMKKLFTTATALGIALAIALNLEPNPDAKAPIVPCEAPSPPVDSEPAAPLPDVRTPVLVRPRVRYELFDADRALLDGVKHFEGYRAKPYVCAGGVKTIGFGSTDKKTVARGHVSRSQAEKILKADLAEAAGHVDRIVKVRLNECERAALISFTFNLGPGKLKTLVGKPGRLNDGNKAETLRMIPKYRLAAGKIQKGLERRRAWEVELFKTPPVERVALK